MKPIDDPDVTRTDRDYWELVLKSHGLGMNEGVKKFPKGKRPKEVVTKIDRD